MMKITAITMVVCFLALTVLAGCGDDMIVNGKVYDTYGLFNEGQKRDQCVDYDLIVGNVIWGIILSETFIAPIYFFGFSLYEPEALISGCGDTAQPNNNSPY